MARRRRKTQDDEDAESMEMELAEVEGRKEAVRQLAPQLALGLRAAMRMLVEVSNHIPPHLMRNEWPIVEQAFDALEEAEPA